MSSTPNSPAEPNPVITPSEPSSVITPSEPSSVITYEDFLEVQDQFDQMRGWQLAKTAFYGADRSLHVALRLSFYMTVVGLFGHVFSVALGADNAWWWAVLELLGAFLIGWLYAMSVERLWLKQLGLSSRPSGRHWLERLQAGRFAQLLGDRLKDRAVRASLLEWADAEFQHQASMLGVQPLVLALVALAIGLLCVWAGQPTVWASGIGYLMFIAVLGVLIVLAVVPEIVTMGHRRRESLKALIRRLP